VENGNAHLTILLNTKSMGEMNTCIQRATAEGLTQRFMSKNIQWEEKRGSKQGVEGLSKGLLLIRGVLVKIVGHEEYIRSRRDEGMARFHNLKAQETECTNQFSTIISVLVKADQHANYFQMFFSILQESRKTLLAALRKRVKRYLHVECAAA